MRKCREFQILIFQSMKKSLLEVILLKYSLLEVILLNIYRNKDQSFNNISFFVFMFAFCCLKPVAYTKANSKKMFGYFQIVFGCGLN